MEKRVHGTTLHVALAAVSLVGLLSHVASLVTVHGQWASIVGPCVQAALLSVDPGADVVAYVSRQSGSITGGFDPGDDVVSSSPPPMHGYWG